MWRYGIEGIPAYVGWEGEGYGMMGRYQDMGGERPYRKMAVACVCCISFRFLVDIFEMENLSILGKT